jgi:hypothetical protein
VSIGGSKVRELMQRRRRGQQQKNGAVHLDPPFGGINASTPMAQIPPQDCIYSYNLFPSRYGMRCRPGYAKWCPPVPLGNGIKTIIPCNASLRGGSQDRLFAVTNDGVYEITTAQAAPIKRYDFTNKGVDAGWCSWHNFTNTAGAQYILICDILNGYFTYDVTANTFAVGNVNTTPASVTAADMAFVAIWKNRVWLIARDSTRAYYMATVGTISGAMTAFDFGAKFKYGGFLKGIYNWTSDGGAGIDDHLVAVSSQGDVVVYTGWDPTTASGEGAFQLRGVWYLGNTPRGRRFVLEEGGDLLMLTAEGVLSLSQLTSGLAVEDERVFYKTQKINTLLRASFRQRENEFGYELTTISRYSMVMLSTPKLVGERNIQWMYSYDTKGWFLARDLPIYTIENWGTRVFFGDTENNIWELIGTRDAVKYDVSTSGTPVEFSLLTSYQGYNAPANLKRVHILRPYWIGAAIPQFGIEARFDFQIDESGTTPPFIPDAGSLWDLSTWDSATWGGGYSVQQLPYGAVGVGRYVAVVMRGTSSGDAAFMGVDVILDQGGML